jgi:thiosulfate dehydrogenase
MIAHRISVLAAVVAAFVTGFIVTPASAAEIESAIARGGKLYDNWYKELKMERPDSAHPSYPASGKYPKQSWRCKECHGWDYKGKDGMLAKGDHNVGIKGITGAAGKDPAAIGAILKDKTHGYDKLGEKDIADLALFVSKGQSDMGKFIDLAAAKPKGNAAKGEVYYNTLCAGCHGVDGKKVSTGAAVGALKDDPWQLLHKAFNGQPAEAMPALRSLDPAIAADIVAYSQTLPQ